MLASSTCPIFLGCPVIDVIKICKIQALYKWQIQLWMCCKQWENCFACMTEKVTQASSGSCRWHLLETSFAFIVIRLSQHAGSNVRNYRVTGCSWYWKGWSKVSRGRLSSALMPALLQCQPLEPGGLPFCSVTPLFHPLLLISPFHIKSAWLFFPPPVTPEEARQLQLSVQFCAVEFLFFIETCGKP